MQPIESDPDLPVPLSTEASISQTVQRLAQETGFRMSRQQLALLIREGRGPRSRSVAHAVRRDIIIEWQDALDWAKEYHMRKPRTPRPDRPIRSVRTVAPDRPINAIEVEPILRLHDCLFIHLKEKYSEQWQRFQKIPGKDRIYRLNELAETALHLVEQLFLAANLDIAPSE